MMPRILKSSSLVVLLLSLIACSGSGDDNGSTTFICTDEDCSNLEKTSQTIPSSDFYNYLGQKSPKANLIADCVLREDNNACPLTQLNFIGNETNQDNHIPSRQEILEKLIVSNPWMATNFSAVLDTLPSEMLDLFASTTAIVIHKDIRPAFFRSSTGAIYLDPIYLWITEDQLNSISEEEDYRASFGRTLDLYLFASYTKGNDLAWDFENRNLLDIKYALSSLLFHELAHARDFFPISSIINAPDNSTPLDIQDVTNTVSYSLEQYLPLNSSTIHQLADVLFKGEAITPTIDQLDAETLGLLFDPEGANDEYAYTQFNDFPHFEDTAMLFEEIMMKKVYDIDREMFFADIVNENVSSCADISIEFQRVNRIFDDASYIRAQFVAERLLPNTNFDQFFNNRDKRGNSIFCQPSPSTTNNNAKYSNSSVFSDGLGLLNQQIKTKALPTPAVYRAHRASKQQN